MRCKSDVNNATQIAGTSHPKEKKDKISNVWQELEPINLNCEKIAVDLLFLTCLSHVCRSVWGCVGLHMFSPVGEASQWRSRTWCDLFLIEARSSRECLVDTNQGGKLPWATAKNSGNLGCDGFNFLNSHFSTKQKKDPTTFKVVLSPKKNQYLMLIYGCGHTVRSPESLLWFLLLLMNKAGMNIKNLLLFWCKLETICAGKKTVWKTFHQQQTRGTEPASKWITDIYIPKQPL